MFHPVAPANYNKFKIGVKERQRACNMVIQVRSRKLIHAAAALALSGQSEGGGKATTRANSVQSDNIDYIVN